MEKNKLIETIDSFPEYGKYNIEYVFEIDLLSDKIDELICAEKIIQKNFGGSRYFKEIESVFFNGEKIIKKYWLGYPLFDINEEWKSTNKKLWKRLPIGVDRKQINKVLEKYPWLKINVNENGDLR